MVTLHAAIRSAEFGAHSNRANLLNVEDLEQRIEEYFAHFNNDSDPGTKRFARVARVETRLSIVEWASFVDVLLEGEADTARHRLQAWARARILSGGRCQCGTTLGRVVALDDLQRAIYLNTNLSATVIARAIGLLLDPDRGWRHGIRYLDDCVNPSSTVQYRQILLARFLMWATFAEDSDDPFEGLDDASVLPALGLPPEMAKYDLLKMIYRLPVGMFGFFPRIVEAAASEKWNPFFLPAPDGAKFGWTDPVPGYYGGGRPELVHPPTAADSLIGPLSRLDLELDVGLF